MKNSSIKAIQKLLNNNYQTVISFGKRIKKPLTKQKVTLLQKQLEISRMLEPKQLWVSTMLEPIIHPLTGLVMGHKTVKVNGTYQFSKHGELGVN
jgi:hypothetical protein